MNFKVPSGPFLCPQPTLRNFIVRYKLYHLVVWLILFALWYYLRYQDYSTTQRALTVTFIKVADLALLILGFYRIGNN